MFNIKFNMMKTTILVLSISILVGCSTGNQYTIKGTLNGFEGSEWVYVQKIWSEELQVDSAHIRNEKFSLKGTIDVPEIYAIFPQPNTEGCQPVCTFILEPAGLNIHLDTISLFNDGTIVSGGELNEEFNVVFREKQEKFFNEIDNLSVRLNEADEDERNIIEQQIKDLNAAETKYTLDYIESHPASPVSLYQLMWKYFSLPPDELGRILSVFSTEMKSTSVYKRIESDAQKLKGI